VPFDRWEALIFAREGPIVWARSEHKQTGVTPYVHERGARVPSLRRLYKKRPYFTNGSAKSLADVLLMARFKGEDFWFYHAGAPEDAALSALTAEEREALLGFLDLL
jgi:cytochrome c peroxidase